ncbi:MAG: 2-oxo acid dehydrogenase subunit E2 [Planctomycetes bacterium]|nr:2-oxo acid dehydrogenase subunit E2 [Planctomycetota bacterium]
MSGFDSDRFSMAHHKSSNPDIFILPDLGEGVHEAEMLKWRVSVGQTVKEHDILADMETDKAVVEVPSPRDGTIAELHGAEGEILHVGNPLVTYVASGGAAAPAASKPAATAEAKPAASTHEVAEPAARTEDAGTVVGNMSGAAAGISAAPGKALATPAVRRLARDLGIDIDSVSGSGIGGRVLERDVRAASGGAAPAVNHAAPAPAPARPAAPAAPAPRPAPSRPAPAASPAPAPAAPRVTFAAGEDITRIPFRGVRRTIATRLRQSIDQAVHFTVMDEADCGALDSLRKKLAAASGEKVSFLPFVASAIARVLGESQFRALNATVDEANPDAAEIIQHRSVHLGIATDTENGLMVPVIRDADRLGVLEISRAIAATANSARDRSIARENLMGSTFTISNVGSHAGRFATPVINYPEVAILAVGRARDGVVVRNGGIFASKLLPLSLACDHRVVDGATAALALARVIELLQSPDVLMGPARG